MGVQWDRATPTDVRDFIVWMRHAKKTGGAKRPSTRDPRVRRNAKTGKRYLGALFQPATINHNETVVHEFHEHHRTSWRLILANPVLRGRADDARVGAHRNPLLPRQRGRRKGSRQGNPKRLPRSMPDDAYNAFFDALTSDRDRALVAMYVSSGARPIEILSMAVGDVDEANALITVVRKGGRIQVLAVSGESIEWFRRYREICPLGAPGEPLWVTLRAPVRALNYDALRALFRRANSAEGTNWTPHDLRRTFATRMLGSGAKPHVVQEILGHASLQTMSVYTAPRLDEMVAAVRALAAPRIERVTFEPSYDAAELAVLFGNVT